MSTEIKFLNIAVDDATEHEWELLKQFFRVRHQAYQDVWGGRSFLDDDGIDAYDQQPGTLFTLALDGEKVVGGVRMVVHTAGSQQKLPLENTFEDDSFALKTLLPHLSDELGSLCYAEAGNIAVLPEYRDKKTANQILNENFDFLKRLEDMGALKLDFCILTANERSIKLAITPAEEHGYKTMVKKETFTHPKVKNKTALVIQSNNKDFPFVSPTLQNARKFIPGLEYLDRKADRRR